MFKSWLASSVILLASFSFFSEYGYAYNQQANHTSTDASVLNVDIVARNRTSNILRRIRDIPNLNIRITPERLRHSFDGHAVELFGRNNVPATPENLRLWQNLIDRAARSNRRLRDFRDGHQTIAYLTRLDNGRWFVAHFFADGPKAGQLATAFFPNRNQISRMLELLRMKP